MQLELDNPYISPRELDDVSAAVERKASLPRGLYYAVLWGAVVFPVPIFLAYLQIIFRPNLPPPQLLDVRFETVGVISLKLSILPVFCGLIAVATYAPVGRYGYLKTFLLYGFVAVVTTWLFGGLTELFGGPFYSPRRFRNSRYHD